VDEVKRENLSRRSFDIFAVGGNGDERAAGILIQRFDRQAIDWITVGTAPAYRTHAASAMLGNEIIITGGIEKGISNEVILSAEQNIQFYYSNLDAISGHRCESRATCDA
jgi:hypothetical protein